MDGKYNFQYSHGYEKIKRSTLKHIQPLSSKIILHQYNFILPYTQCIMLHSISLYSTFHTVIYRAQFSLYSTFDVPGMHVEYVDITGRSNVDTCLLKWVDLVILQILASFQTLFTIYISFGKLRD